MVLSYLVCRAQEGECYHLCGAKNGFQSFFMGKYICNNSIQSWTSVLARFSFVHVEHCHIRSRKLQKECEFCHKNASKRLWKRMSNLFQNRSLSLSFRIVNNLLFNHTWKLSTFLLNLYVYCSTVECSHIHGYIYQQSCSSFYSKIELYDVHSFLDYLIFASSTFGFYFTLMCLE